MPRQRVKKNVKQPTLSTRSDVNGEGANEPPIENTEGAIRPKEPKEKAEEFGYEEAERRCNAARAMRNVAKEQLSTELCLLRLNFDKQQLQTPTWQFFEDNLPNLLVKLGENRKFEVQWKDKDDNLSMYHADERSIHASLLHRLSVAYPNCFTTSNAVCGSLLDADALQKMNFGLEDLSDTQMLGLHDGLKTPGVSSSRLSVGTTPKTLRVPKAGEMLLSVNGSPLGVYKEDNMEAINESDES